jgi:hypothetical protein
VREAFGYSEFREHQCEVIGRAMDSEDVLASLYREREELVPAHEECDHDIRVPVLIVGNGSGLSWRKMERSCFRAADIYEQMHECSSVAAL